MGKNPSEVRSRELMKRRSRSSESDVSRLADWASVRAMMTVGMPATSEARRAQTSLVMNSCMGTSALPAADVDRLEARAHQLHGLVAGDGSERMDVVLGVDQVPELLGAEERQRVVQTDRAAQAHDVGAAVRALDAFPTRARAPVLLE